jgi:hypothetical protein
MYQSRRHKQPQSAPGMSFPSLNPAFPPSGPLGSALYTMNMYQPHVDESDLMIQTEDPVDSPFLTFPPPQLTNYIPYTPKHAPGPLPLQPWPLSSRLVTNAVFPNPESSTSISEPSISSFSFVKRLATYRLPFEDSPMTMPQMTKYIGMELERKPSVEVPDLVERLYPDAALPFPITTDILRHPTMAMYWDKTGMKWRFKEVYNEVALSLIMNNIAYGIGQIFNQHRRRFWTAGLRDSSPTFTGRHKNNPPCRLKPDLALIPRSAIMDPDDPLVVVCRKINWEIIRGLGEITKEKVLPLRTKQTINNKSYVLLLTQPERIFVPSLIVYSEPQRLRFHVTDRDGQVYSDFCFGQEGEVNALRLLRIITAFAFGDTKLHGRDPTIAEGPDGIKITAGGITYSNANLIHSSQSMIGRCTRVWSAKHPVTALRVIIKDGWLHHTRADSEPFYLKKLQKAGILGVPTIIWDGVVGSDGDESTLTIRRGFFSEQDYRIHRRIVMTPSGEPLTTFTSLSELISALRDVVSSESHPLP